MGHHSACTQAFRALSRRTHATRRLMDYAAIHGLVDHEAKLLFNQSRSKYNISCDYIGNLLIHGNPPSLARQC